MLQGQSLYISVSKNSNALISESHLLHQPKRTLHANNYCTFSNEYHFLDKGSKHTLSELSLTSLNFFGFAVFFLPLCEKKSGFRDARVTACLLFNLSQFPYPFQF